MGRFEQRTVAGSICPQGLARARKRPRTGATRARRKSKPHISEVLHKSCRYNRPTRREGDGCPPRRHRSSRPIAIHPSWNNESSTQSHPEIQLNRDGGRYWRVLAAASPITMKRDRGDRIAPKNEQTGSCSTDAIGGHLWSPSAAVPHVPPRFGISKRADFFALKVIRLSVPPASLRPSISGSVTIARHP